MTRVLSAIVLLPIVLGIAWYLPPIYTTLLVGLVTLLAFVEYASLATLLSPGFPRAIAGVATLVTYVAVWAGVPLALVLAPALLVAAAAGLLQPAVHRHRRGEQGRARRRVVRLALGRLRIVPQRDLDLVQRRPQR